MSFDHTLPQIFCMLIAFLIAVIGHEIMHGFVALHYGDDTAKNAGRLTLNPLSHLDLIGSILLPLGLFLIQAPFLFGWAKPVPVDINTVYRNRGYVGCIFVSLAGVIFNLSLALIASTILKYGLGGDGQSLLNFFLLEVVVFNVVLGVFNLLPIPPLDGSQALSFLSLKLGYKALPRLFARIQKYGFFILMFILLTPLSQIFLFPVNFLFQFLMS